MGMKPIVIPVLDFRNLKQVKTYKDWFGYSQKLERSVKLLRSRIQTLETERAEYNSKFTKLRAQNQNLYQLNKKLSKTVKDLNDKVAELKNSRRPKSYFWNNKFDMTMPHISGNFDSFTISEMEKTLNNKKMSMMNMTQEMQGNLENCYSEEEEAPHQNIDKELNQFSQNSSSNRKESSDDRVTNKKYINESPDFQILKNTVSLKDDKVPPKSQIKNPSDINKYVARTKKRGHARKVSKLDGSKKVDENSMSNTTIEPVPKSKPKINSKIVNRTLSFENFDGENSVKKVKNSGLHSYK